MNSPTRRSESSHNLSSFTPVNAQLISSLDFVTHMSREESDLRSIETSLRRTHKMHRTDVKERKMFNRSGGGLNVLNDKNTRENRVGCD